MNYLAPRGGVSGSIPDYKKILEMAYKKLI
jgi:hypothetical protein